MSDPWSAVDEFLTFIDTDKPNNANYLDWALSCRARAA